MRIGREILYKGKQKSAGDWIFGVPIQHSDGDWQIHGGFSNAGYSVTVDKETICEYTGLHDNTKWEELSEKEKKDFLNEWNHEKRIYNEKEDWCGKKIFENDILFVVEKMGTDVYQDGILVSRPRWENKSYFKVEFNPGSLMNTQRFCDSKSVECKLTGNIFDNPSLLQSD